MNIKIHTLIIGGGPAGSLCGIGLKKAGKDCLIVDRATFPRMKLCAGVVTGKSREVLGEVLGEEKTKELLVQTMASHESHLRLWDRKHCFVDCDMSSPRMIPKDYRDGDWRFVMVDRPRFDAALIRIYKEMGGQLIEGDGVRTIDFDNQVATLQSGTTVEYHSLVAADGANSHTEHLLKRYADDFTPKGSNAEAYEINVARADLDIDGVNVCFGYVPQTYAWAFAKGDKICLGTCKLPGTRFSGREAMRQFCEDLGLKHAERYPLQGAMIPFDNAMPRPMWHGRVFFVGDAAGLDEAVTGEGIFYALRSGADAAEAIATANPTLYIQRNAYLQALMKKAAKYQKVLANKRLFPIFKVVARMFNRFVAFFYLTQIDHASLDHLRTICRKYIRRL